MDAVIDGVAFACNNGGQYDYRQYDDEDDIKPAACDNCVWTGVAGDTVRPIPDLDKRLDPNGEVPIGEYPSCGALAYLHD
jgi:hypothetical protein